MNKNVVNELIPLAMQVCNCEKDKVDEKTHNKLSAFGATIIMSGLKPAIAGFSKQEKKIVIDLVDCLINKRSNKPMEEPKKLMDYLSGKDNEDYEELVVNCVIALKLAVDAYVERHDG